MQQLIGIVAVELALPSHLKIHPVVHVVHRTPFTEQPRDIAKPIPERPVPVPTVYGDEHVVEKILKHRKRGRGYQFLTLMKGVPTHDAVWQPTRDFVDSDETVTAVWQRSNLEAGIIPKYH